MSSKGCTIPRKEWFEKEIWRLKGKVSLPEMLLVSALGVSIVHSIVRQGSERVVMATLVLTLLYLYLVVHPRCDLDVHEEVDVTPSSAYILAGVEWDTL